MRTEALINDVGVHRAPELCAFQNLVGVEADQPCRVNGRSRMASKELCASGVSFHAVVENIQNESPRRKNT